MSLYDSWQVDVGHTQLTRCPWHCVVDLLSTPVVKVVYRAAATYLFINRENRGAHVGLTLSTFTLLYCILDLGIKILLDEWRMKGFEICIYKEINFLKMELKMKTYHSE